MDVAHAILFAKAIDISRVTADYSSAKFELQKYYAEPNRYSVESGIIRCGTLWSLYIDNESSEYVVAYLGDLGRDLPSREQKHWKTYNIVIDGKLSKSKIMRDFFVGSLHLSLLFLYFKTNMKK